MFTPLALPPAVVLRPAEVGGEVDTVVVVTDAEDGRGGLSGRMDEDDIAPSFSLFVVWSKRCALIVVPSPSSRQGSRVDVELDYNVMYGGSQPKCAAD